MCATVRDEFDEMSWKGLMLLCRILEQFFFVGFYLLLCLENVILRPFEQTIKLNDSVCKL